MNVTEPTNHYEVGESTTRVGLNVEYRVRAITRYIVTRYEQEVLADGRDQSGLSKTVGSEYRNYDTAYQVAYALAKAEHERLGYRPDDMRLQYPKPEAALLSPLQAQGILSEHRLGGAQGFLGQQLRSKGSQG